MKDLYRGSVPFFLSKLNGKVIYLCSSNKNINDYYNTIIDFYDGEILKLEDIEDENDDYKKKYKFLDIIENKKKYIVLMSLSFFLSKFFFEEELFSLKIGKKINFKLLEYKLRENGFIKNYLVEKPLEYSIRGDILDLYLLNKDNPIRIECFGEEIDRLTYFDVNTQKSILNIENIDVYISKNKDKKYNFFEFLDKKNQRDINFYLENVEILNYKLESYILKDRLEENKYRNIYTRCLKNFHHITTNRLDIDNQKEYNDIRKIKDLSENKKIIILSKEKKIYDKIFENYKNIETRNYPHFEGFYYKDALVLTDREIKGISVKKEDKVKESIKYNNINQIKENDFIIHENYGVGKYLGIEIIDGKDYLMIQYAGEDKLFVPVENLNKIEKYVSELGKIPEIYNLGRRGFKRRKLKLEEEIKKFAKEILNIQAKRETTKGYSFSKDTVWQEEFEELFPYTETKDQLEAIDMVKKDMESSFVMDRIICGDVGFGKTEVAMRATFKCVTDNKQVLILTPTTVLAEQHYERFKNRFYNYPINIALMSRGKSKKEQSEILKKIYIKGIDVIIGTHRLLSKDVRFNDLGLIIVDEEQKFGVKSKEKLKKIKENVDILTLTATPIPRTLNLSLLGIRDISIIKTPPVNRKPVKNMFIDKNKKNIKEIILKEVSREGQVFYVYNSVEKMDYKLNELKNILPDFIKIKSLHGQMPPDQIKNIIHNFENGEIDVLLTTTIIENGIDIENANTIIIEGIEKLGLSQIYQLRGRVGRGSRQAYCYLINDLEKKYTKKTMLRKESIEKITGIGGGFELSLEDMNIRGAGEILGEKQHGAIESFGFNLYLKLLNEEISKLKENYEENQDIKIDIKQTGFIPKEYIEGYEKINIYKRISEIKSLKESGEVLKEIRDRFGKIPAPVSILFKNINIKVKAKKLGIKEIKEEKKNVYIIKFDNLKINFDKILTMIRENKCELNNNESIKFYKYIEEFFNEYEEVKIERI
ncbi:transcription-repair coupling factor [Fusobacterium sp. MFO224]|uniref:transcription-repair coupling factor n=1 Tax=Fusobacterium sp. MFO224 TaxID=3378070 RepID=UPI0038541C1A